jgi:hypothetical protein
MKKPKVDDKLQTVIDRPYATVETHRKAYEVLSHKDQAGKLPPIEGWEGSTLDGWVDILGIQR